MEPKNVTAATIQEMDKKIQDLIAQDWHANEARVQNPDNSYPQRMVKTVIE